MRLKDIKTFCNVCGSIFDNARLKNCNYCKNKLTKVIEFDQCFSQQDGKYTLKLNNNLYPFQIRGKEDES